MNPKPQTILASHRTMITHLLSHLTIWSHTTCIPSGSLLSWTSSDPRRPGFTLVRFKDSQISFKVEKQSHQAKMAP